MENRYLIISGILLILILGTITYLIIDTESEELTSEEKILTAIKSTELASHGWRTEQDRNAGLFALGGYINSVVNEEGDI